MTPLETLAIHPYLIAAHQIVFSWSHNMAEIRAGKIIYPLSITLLITLLIMTFASRPPRAGSKTKAAAALSAFWLLFFSYGPAEQLTVEALPAAAGWPFFILWLIAVGVSVKKILYSTADFGKINAILNFTAAALIFMPACNIIIFEYNSAAPGTEILTGAGEKQPAAPQNRSFGRPDVYHLVFDGYPRADVLKEIYGYDNSEFMNYLKNKGFFVAEKSYANYGTFTLPSIASFLNFDYYQSLLSGGHGEDRSFESMITLLQQNAAARFLKKLGYTFVSYNALSGVIYTSDILLMPPEFRRGPLADIYYDYFYNHLINKTPLALYYKYFSKEFDFSMSEGTRMLCNYMFSTVPNMRRPGGIIGPERGPLFVYAHFPLPHPPFVFDENGADFAGWKYFDSPFGDANRIVRTPKDRENYIKFYVNHIKYLNKKVIGMIDEIIKNSKEPPVIIVQADHGPGSDFNYSDINALTPSGLYERYAILNAYYFRGRAMDEAYLKKTGLHEGITPVNSYRVVFNEIFGANLKLLPDRCFYATDKRPYDFTEIEIKRAAGSK